MNPETQAAVARVERDAVKAVISRWLNVGFLADQTYLVQAAQALGLIGAGQGWLERTDPAEARAVAAEAALATEREKVEALERERESLHLAICGGEDAPGFAASLTHDVILGVLRDNYASWRRDSEMAWDGETATSWKARAQRAEALLAEAGRVAGPFARYATAAHPKGLIVGVTTGEGVFNVTGDDFCALRTFLDKLENGRLNQGETS